LNQRELQTNRGRAVALRSPRRWARTTRVLTSAAVPATL